MTNDKLRKRICLLLATSYALDVDEIERAYNKLGSFDKLLNLLETNRLQQVLSEIKK